MTTTQDSNLNNTQNTTDELAVYLVNVANKLQSKVDDVSINMNKKLEEMTTRIDSLERSLKQMEKAPANNNLNEADHK
ncbi:uncharacterized protein ATC70_003495 [Mucor velutinosus]|uniref:Uncharacterized protein n=1 Tax=Mucor velutinosus TaxID=708070 RepID=A0AAN7DA68_9FUNG|nr:hypothetical protein ATC70_003495 [Mucor velutinosus]